MIKKLPVVELLGKKWIVDERLKQFRTEANFGEPIVFISDQEMDDMLSIKEILDDPTKFEIDSDTITKLRKLLDSAVEGDRDAINEIGKIYHCEDCGDEKACIREVELLSEVSNNIKDAYPDGKCPDCFEPIPDHITDGDKCQNCGHIFHRLEIENSKRIEEMRDDGYQQREKGWSKGTGL